MQVKAELRKELKNVRKNINCKSENDRLICNNLLRCNVYNNAKIILFYAALDDEINIDDCIINALNSGKDVALPVCTDSNGNMDFYYINSMSDLVEGHFGVREPNTATCTKVTDFTDSVCIVPAISYDKLGYRLGYGKGYYDRFLKKFTIISVGMCYNELITDRLPIGEYDVPVDYIITQDGVFSVRNGG